MVFYWFHWTKTKQDRGVVPIKNAPSISVVIVGRNEAKNLMSCVDSIISNDYPKSQFEVLYIDDFSTDNSIEILKAINFENFNFFKLKDFIGDNKIINYKKTAIEFAVSKAIGDIILQTDADTIVGEKWILSHANKYSSDKINFITGPVLFKSGNSSLEEFQKYDFLATMGVTCAGINSGLHYMANGANMSYRKGISTKSNSNYASGDDMFLVQKIAKDHPNSIGFLKNKDAIVYTYPESTIKEFINQRLRWATKTKAYESPNMKYIVILIFVTNLLILSNIIAILFLKTDQLYFAISLVLFKLIVDSIFIKSIASFFEEKISAIEMFIALLKYPIYIVFIGVLSLFKNKYQWKSRIVK